MARRVLQIATEDTHVRERLSYIISEYLESHDIADIVVASDEGSTGVAATDALGPAIVVLASGPGEEVPAHLFWYRRSAPAARLVGVAFSDAQEAAFRASEVDAVARAAGGRRGFLQALGVAVP